MPLVKSHSNYVLSQKHQDIKDGTIYERDITTIGGVDSFSPGQTPIYRSNNFIVTVRDDEKVASQYNSGSKWKKNGTSGEVWTLESVSALTSDFNDDDDTKITLKPDYYDLSNFAYYGSMTELFRSSVTDIISRFPGELYATYNTNEGGSKVAQNAYYTSGYTEGTERIEESIVLGGTGLTYIDNPFGIDIHTTQIEDVPNPLKYFANNGYQNYNVIRNNGDECYITSWKVTAYTNSCKGEQIARIEIRYKSPSSSSNTYRCRIQAWIGDNNEIIYLTDSSLGFHIRPKRIFLEKFYNECDNFEKLLMNEETDYRADFSVIRENELGYYRELVPLTFPRGSGGYNLDTSNYGFNSYTTQMVEIGEYYDENFSDNLWRSMTHEAIKNFDWSYTREIDEDDEEANIFGGQRIQKALRLFGREFDEIISYINAMKNVNKVTYDASNNVPDYFLTDLTENSGFDTKLTYPYILTEYEYIDGIKTEFPISGYVEGGKDSDCSGQLDNRNGKPYQDADSRIITREFSQDSNSEFVPYPFENWGYFNLCEDTVPSSAKSDTLRFDSWALGGKGVVRDVIRTYYDDIKWTAQKANNEFLRRLTINAPYIWRNKGTIEGIESILSMFGLKSKRWCDSRNISGYDYDVTEYTSVVKPIEESWDAIHQEYRINWINSTKTISYDNRSLSNYNRYGIDNEKIEYEGIPVSYRDEYINDNTKNTAFIGKAPLEQQINSGITGADSASCFVREDGTPVVRRYLYPNFNSNELLDGNPYFQMDGGWLSKLIKNNDKVYNFQFDINDNIVYSDYFSGSSEYTTDDNGTLFKETIRNIRRVDNINELLTIPTNSLYNGIICNVTKVDKEAVVIDGVVYPIITEWYGIGSNAKVAQYVSFVKNNGYIKVGLDKYFDSAIIVYNGDGIETLYNIDEKENGYEVKAYLNDNQFVCKEDANGNYSISTFIRLDKAWSGEGYTNYFILDDIYYASELSKVNTDEGTFTSGWRRLTEYSNDYLKINTITNYYNGNNPHNGNMVYDNGHEYYTYFSRLFKHAVTNDLFDSREYDDYFMSIEEIAKYGFSGLVNPNEDVKQYDNFLIPDTKIHYFGNYKTTNGNGIDKVWIYGQDIDKWNTLKSQYAGETSSTNMYTLSATSNNGWIESAVTNPYSVYDGLDEVTNQIVNNKRLKINFNLHYKWYTKTGQEELKYLDDIVMNYLTQLIPSSTILQIQYTSKS